MQSLLHVIAHILLNCDQNPQRVDDVRNTLTWSELDSKGRHRRCMIIVGDDLTCHVPNIPFKSIDPAKPGADLEEWVDDLRKAYQEFWKNDVPNAANSYAKDLNALMDKMVERAIPSELTRLLTGKSTPIDWPVDIGQRIAETEVRTINHKGETIDQDASLFSKYLTHINSYHNSDIKLSTVSPELQRGVERFDAACRKHQISRTARVLAISREIQKRAYKPPDEIDFTTPTEDYYPRSEWCCTCRDPITIESQDKPPIHNKCVKSEKEIQEWINSLPTGENLPESDTIWENL